MAKRKRKKNKKVKRSKKRKSIKKKKLIKRSSKKYSNKQVLLKDEEGNNVIKVSDKWSNQAYVNSSRYKSKYNLSIKENDKFWKKEGKRLNWIKPYSKIKDVKYSKEEVKIKWFYDGVLNASSNCIDRHLKKMERKLQ